MQFYFKRIFTVHVFKERIFEISLVSKMTGKKWLTVIDVNGR